MNTLPGFLKLVLLAWLAPTLWIIGVATCHTLALFRMRAASRRPADGFLDEVYIAHELRQAERTFGEGIERIDDAYHLSRPRRHRFDAGVPSCPGGSDHEDD